MGYSDTTVSHFVMRKAGIVSYYGPSVMCEFGEYVKMFDYTKEAVENILFKDTAGYEVKPSKYWSDDFCELGRENINHLKKSCVKMSTAMKSPTGSGIISANWSEDASMFFR